MNRPVLAAAAGAWLLAITLTSGTLAAKRPASDPASDGIDITFYQGMIDPWTPPAGHAECDRKSGSAIYLDFRKGPPRECAPDDFSAHGQGRIVAPTTGTVTFCSINDDGFALRIGETRVISDWVGHGPEVCNAYGSFEMVENRKYPIEFWYFDIGGSEFLGLYWDPAGGNDWVRVPKEALFRN